MSRTAHCRPIQGAHVDALVHVHAREPRKISKPRIAHQHPHKPAIRLQMRHLQYHSLYLYSLPSCSPFLPTYPPNSLRFNHIQCSQRRQINYSTQGPHRRPRYHYLHWKLSKGVSCGQTVQGLPKQVAGLQWPNSQAGQTHMTLLHHLRPRQCLAPGLLVTTQLQGVNESQHGRICLVDLPIEWRKRQIRTRLAVKTAEHPLLHLKNATGVDLAERRKQRPQTLQYLIRIPCQPLHTRLWCLQLPRERHWTTTTTYGPNPPHQIKLRVREIKAMNMSLQYLHRCQKSRNLSDRNIGVAACS